MSIHFQSWIGVDLDATLAYYDGWKSPEHIGDPIPAMLDRVLKWIDQGKDVRIFTARIWPLMFVRADDNMNQFVGANEREHQAARSAVAIHLWCEKHLGKRLPITCAKDMAMSSCWDDRSVQIVANTGMRVDGCSSD